MTASFVMFVPSVCPHGMNDLALIGPIFVKFYFILPTGESKPSSGSHSVAALAPHLVFIFSIHLFICRRTSSYHSNVHSSMQLLLLLPSLFSFLLFFLYSASARFRAMAFPLTGFPDNWTEVKILDLHPSNFCSNTNLSKTDIFMSHCLLGSSSVFTSFSSQFKHECNSA